MTNWGAINGTSLHTKVKLTFCEAGFASSRFFFFKHDNGLGAYINPIPIINKECGSNSIHARRKNAFHDYQVSKKKLEMDFTIVHTAYGESKKLVLSDPNYM